MKKIFVLLMVAAAIFSFTACSDDSSDDSVPILSVTDVTGWDEINWDDLNDETYGNWMVGEWDCKYRTINNIEDENDLKLYEGKVLVTIEGTDSSSSVIFSDAEGKGVVNGTVTFSTLKNQINSAYDEKLFDNVIESLESYGFNINWVHNKNVWKKVNPDRTKMEFYKSVVISGTYQDETHVLTIQTNESFVKRSE